MQGYTEEQVQQAFDDGKISMTDYNQYLDGEDVDFSNIFADTSAAAGDGGDPADSAADTDDSGDPGSAAAAEAEAQAAAEAAAAVAAQAAAVGKQEEEPGEDPVILAKDGKHVIPFSVLEDARETLRITQAQNDQLIKMLNENKGIEKKVEIAQAADDASGTTDAMDNLLKDIEEDYPGITKTLQSVLIQPLQEQIKTLTAAEESRRKVTEEEQRQADEVKRQTLFDNSVIEIEPRYAEAKSSPAFWSWFHSQPKHIRVVQNSGDREAVAEVIGIYYNTAGKKPAAGSDTPAKPQATAVEEAAKKMAEAVQKAKGKTIVGSLTDVPGGTNPAHDAMEAFHQLSEDEQLNRMLNMTPKQLEEHLNRSV